MNFKTERVALKDTYTIGKFYIDYEDGEGFQYFCDTLEPQVRSEGSEKVFGKTAIPYGTYKVTLVQSPKFNRIVPLINDVPGFEAIEIHIGNYPHDTEGCTLVGKNTIVGQLTESTITFNKLMDIITNSGEQEFTIQII